MARSTANNSLKPAKGMMRFEVIRSTIKDTLGQYCVPGDFAILTKKEAQDYLDKNLIRVALPDFEDEADDEDAPASTPVARPLPRQRGQAASTASAGGGEGSEGSEANSD